MLSNSIKQKGIFFHKDGRKYQQTNEVNKTELSKTRLNGKFSSVRPSAVLIMLLLFDDVLDGNA
jgi:hypothetical protein